MRLQQIADELDEAIGYAKYLEDSPAKTSVLTGLTKARGHIDVFGNEMVEALDLLGKSLYES